MNDKKLKIRIQLPQQSKEKERPKSIDELYPETESTATTQPDKSSFDQQKILIALLLTALLIGLIIYLFTGQNNAKPVPDETDQIMATNKNTTASIDPPLVEPVIENIVEESTELSQSNDKNDTEPTPEANPEDTGQIPVPEIKTIPRSINTLDKSVVSADENALIKNTLEDQPQIVRAQLTSAIEQREPVDIIDHIWIGQDQSTKKIIFFMHLRDLAGQRVSVHWQHQDKVIAKVTLTIGSNNWRTYASKLLNKSRLGSWHVSLHDQTGKLLSQRKFTVGIRS